MSKLTKHEKNAKMGRGQRTNDHTNAFLDHFGFNLPQPCADLKKEEEKYSRNGMLTDRYKNGNGI